MTECTQCRGDLADCTRPWCTHPRLRDAIARDPPPAGARGESSRLGPNAAKAHMRFPPEPSGSAKKNWPVKYSASAIERARNGALEWFKGAADGFPRSWEQEARHNERRGYVMFDDFEAPPIAGYEALEREGLAVRGETIAREDGEERVHFRYIVPDTARLMAVYGRHLMEQEAKKAAGVSIGLPASWRDFCATGEELA